MSFQICWPTNFIPRGKKRGPAKGTLHKEIQKKEKTLCSEHNGGGTNSSKRVKLTANTTWVESHAIYHIPNLIPISDHHTDSPPLIQPQGNTRMWVFVAIWSWRTPRRHLKLSIHSKVAALMMKTQFPSGPPFLTLKCATLWIQSAIGCARMRFVQCFNVSIKVLISGVARRGSWKWWWNPYQLEGE